jgi:hypothetical protein
VASKAETPPYPYRVEKPRKRSSWPLVIVCLVPPALPVMIGIDDMRYGTQAYLEKQAIETVTKDYPLPSQDAIHDALEKARSFKEAADPFVDEYNLPNLDALTHAGLADPFYQDDAETLRRYNKHQEQLKRERRANGAQEAKDSNVLLFMEGGSIGVAEVLIYMAVVSYKNHKKSRRQPDVV